jgi:hypothetical protein
MRVLDKAEYTSAVGGETVKEQYLAREGQVVSKERFIFACYEAQNHLSKIDGSFKKEFEWPELDHSTVEAFNSRLERMLAWHYSNHAVFHNHKTMDLASLTYLSIQLAHLEKDFKRLCAQSGMLEDKNGRPVQIALNELTASIKKIFSNTLTDYITSYFNWIYTKPKMTVVDFDQVPPVGRYAKMVIHSRAHKTHAEPLLDQAQATPKTNQRPPEAKNHEKNTSPSAQRDFGNQPGGKRDSRPDRGAYRDRKPEAEKNPAQEAATLSLVDDALKLLQTDSSLNEVVLEPQNSYYRRLQHQRAVDAGFLSDSIGEGKERAVKISRPK